MINIDTRLIPQINEKELWLLIQIVRRINLERFCWPSNSRLLEDTGWHIEKLQSVKKSLVKKGIIEIELRGDKSNIYKIKTEYLGVFVTAKGEFMEQNESTYSPDGKTDPLQKTDNLGIGKTNKLGAGKTNNEVLTSEVLFKEEETDVSYLVIDHLNNVKKNMGVAGKSQWTPERAKLIKRRMKGTGATLEDIKHMIAFKVMDWRGTKVESHLQIKTLFGDKFVDYLEQAQNQPAKGWVDKSIPDVTESVEVDPAIIYNSMFDKKQNT